MAAQYFHIHFLCLANALYLKCSSSYTPGLHVWQSQPYFHSFKKHLLGFYVLGLYNIPDSTIQNRKEIVPPLKSTGYCEDKDVNNWITQVCREAQRKELLSLSRPLTMAPFKSALMSTSAPFQIKINLISHPLLVPLQTHHILSPITIICVPVHFSLDCKLHEGTDYTFCFSLLRWLPQCFKPTKHKNVS